MTTSLGFQLLFAMLGRGGALFLKGVPQETFKALSLYCVQSAIVTSDGLSDFVEFANESPSYECHLDTIFCVESSLSPDVINQARSRLCANISVGYHLTECGMVSSMPVQFGSEKKGAAGFIMPGTLVQIVGDDGTILTANKAGRVRLKSRAAVNEYLQDPSASSIMFRDDWFYPGDIGYLTEENMLFLIAKPL